MYLGVVHLQEQHAEGQDGVVVGAWLVEPRDVDGRPPEAHEGAFGEVRGQPATGLCTERKLVTPGKNSDNRSHLVTLVSHGHPVNQL